MSTPIPFPAESSVMGSTEPVREGMAGWVFFWSECA